MNLIKRLFKALLVILILAVFALAIWQNRAWIQAHGQPILAKLQHWASQGTWNENEETPKTTHSPPIDEHAQAASEVSAAPMPESAEMPHEGTEPEETTPDHELAETETPATHEMLPTQQHESEPVADNSAVSQPALALEEQPGESIAEEGDSLAVEPGDEANASPVMEQISQVRQWVWEGRLDKARDTLQQAIEQDPENPAYLWELMQLERYSQHFHQAAQLQWRLQLLAMKAQQEQQLEQMKQWQAKVGEQQARLHARIRQLEDELERTRHALAQPLENQP